MGWRAFKIVTCAAAVLGAMGLLGVAPAHADQQSYFDRLNAESIGDYITTEQAVQIGNWVCQQLRGGRSTQAVYSDFMDMNQQQRWLPANGPVGIVMGAAIFQLCPEMGKNWNGFDDLEYIPVSQR